MVQQEEAQYQAQKMAAKTAQEAQTKAEREFFESDRNLSRVAENLEDVFQAKAIIEELDKEK